MAALARNVDVLVIGAGQAGLALGYHLATTPLRSLIVDRKARIGDSWRNRYDSLVLFTPRAYSALPGLPVPGNPQGYPSKDEMADYLEQYAVHFSLPVETGMGIRSLAQLDGRFQAITDTGEVIHTQAVVLATGAFQRPAIPTMARQLSPGVVQLTPESYKNAAQIPSGSVLVVGDGATGRQIASELSTSHDVLLSTGRSRRVSPERILGRSVFWWMDKLGVLRASRESRVGQYVKKTDPFPGKELELKRLQHRGVRVVGRLAGADRSRIAFDDGMTADVDTVIWATGYKDESEWVAIPEVKDSNGAFVQRRGVSPVPNLYFIGRSWQWTRGSALLTGVGDDASYIVSQIVEQLHHGPVALRIEATTVPA